MDLLRASDPELVAATPGDGEAFGELYRRHEEAILVYMLRRVRGADAAADLTAEVFAAALGAVGGYEPSRGPVVGWLFGIAHHVLAASRRRARVVDAARRRAGLPPLELTDELIEHLERLAAIGAGTDALKRLRQLPDDQRRAIEAVVLGDRDLAAAAVELRCSKNVVSQRVSRGLKTLRDQLESYR